MSLFENSFFRWRETYFVLFRSKDRPSAESAIEALKQLGTPYNIDGVRADDDGLLETLTLYSPDDFAAMDISYIVGEEVAEQVEALQAEWGQEAVDGEEAAYRRQLADCDARFDIYHFEQLVPGEEQEDEDGFLDPGSLLIVLQMLAGLCSGVGVDPQSGTLIY